MKKFLILLISGYRYFISPFLGRNCRFSPTCSEFALLVIKKHGVIKGGIMIIARLSKCHPWYNEVGNNE